MIVTGYGTLAIDDDDCVRILDEAGFLPTSGIASVYLIDVPRGLNAKKQRSSYIWSTRPLSYPPARQLGNRRLYLLAQGHDFVTVWVPLFQQND
jgi:hypothetical protein